MALRYDQPKRIGDPRVVIVDPTWPDLEAAIRRLDAAEHTLVTLGEEAHLSVGGGAGTYLVAIFTEDERSLVAVDQSKSQDARAVFVAGGQRVSVPSRHVVGLDVALEAAKEYCSNGRPAPNLTWIEE